MVTDLFDIIDTKQDKVLDFEEWNLAFNLPKTNSTHRLLSSTLCLWENSFEASKFAVVIAKNRKLLMEHIQRLAQPDSNGQGKLVSFN